MRVVASTITAAVLTVALGGCAADEPAKPAPARPSPSASPALSGAKAEVAEKALAAYTGFYREYGEATADPSKPPNIAKYAADPLRTEVGLYLLRMRQKGQISRGEPKLSPRVKTVSDDVKQVTISDCYDNNGATVVVKATGKDVTAPGQVQRYVSEAQVDLYADGTWLVSKITPQRGTPC